MLDGLYFFSVVGYYFMLKNCGKKQRAMDQGRTFSIKRNSHLIKY